MFPIYFFGMAVIGAIIHILIGKTPVLDTFLLYFLMVEVGLESLFAFRGHWFASDDAANSIGWPTGSPFQGHKKGNVVITVEHNNKAQDREK